MTTAFNPKLLKTADINEAYDLLVAHFRAHPGIVPSGTSVEAHTISLMSMKLKEAGYAQADYIDALIRNHVAKSTRQGTAPATPATARQNAIAIFTAVTGKAPVVTVPVPAPEAAAPAADDAAAAAAADTKAPETKAAETNDTDNQNAPVETAGADSGETMPQTLSTEFTPSRIAALTIAPEQVTAIDAILPQVSQGKLRSIKDMIQNLLAAEEAVFAQTRLKIQGQAKLKALKVGDVEGAEVIPFELPKVPFRGSGVGAVKLEGPMVIALDQLLTNATGGAATSANEIIAEIAKVEKAAADNAKELAQLNREIRAAMPKKSITINAGSADSEETAYEAVVVMKRASEIFTDAFGMSSPILDFDVPTLEFTEPHPDIPKLDPTFRFYAPVLADVLDCLVNNEIAWLYGDSGCGKSEFWLQVAARLNFPVVRLNMDSHVTRGDLVGQNRLVPGPTGAPVMKFIDGLVPRALKTPSIMLIDEIDLGDPEVMPVLQPVLEGRGIRILEDGGRYVAPHEWSRIGCTANTIGLGSENQMYNNAHEQSAATRDRIGRFIKMPYLPPEKELEVVLARVPDADPEFAKKVIALAGKVREGYEMDQVHQVFSTRTVQRAVRRHAKFAPLYGDDTQAIHSTLEVTILGRCDKTSREVIKGLADAIFV